MLEEWEGGREGWIMLEGGVGGREGGREGGRSGREGSVTDNVNTKMSWDLQQTCSSHRHCCIVWWCLQTCSPEDCRGNQEGLATWMYRLHPSYLSSYPISLRYHFLVCLRSGASRGSSESNWQTVTRCKSSSNSTQLSGSNWTWEAVKLNWCQLPSLSFPPSAGEQVQRSTWHVAHRGWFSISLWWAIDHSFPELISTHVRLCSLDYATQVVPQPL